MTSARSIAGLPVLRLLAEGTRSRIWLTSDDRVLKVLTSPPPGQPAAEALALHRARGEHVVELLDVFVDEAQAVLVFPRLPRGSLADFLDRPGGLDAGEVVTALVPLATALSRMHAAGIAHTALSASCVLFSGDGAPVLTGFGGATPFAEGLPEVARENLDGVIVDRAALAGIAATALARVTGTRASAAADLAARLAGRDHQDLEIRLTHELFELAAARPIREGDRAESTVTRVVGVAEVEQPEIEEPLSAVPGWTDAVIRALGPVLDSGPVAPVRERMAQLWSDWSSRRRRAVLAGAAAVLVLLIAIPAIPGGGPGSTGAGQPAAAGTPVASPDPPTPDASASVVAGDDPVAAVDALLRRRTDCLRDLSVLCLSDVDEQGSAAFDDDAAAIDAIIADGVQPALIDGSGATLIELLGASALVGLRADSRPASVLLMKGEAGWRIRDYLAPAGAEAVAG